MNAKDGSSSNLGSSSEDKKDKKENVENEDENPGEEVVTKTDATDCDTKSLKEEPDCLENKCESSLELPLEPTLHERFLRIKQTVKDAIAAHHTFMIYGKSRVIRDCMLKRGWCEKFYRRNSGGDQHFNVDSNPVLLLAGIGDLKDQQSERLLMSRMLANHTVDFLWNTGSDWPGWPAQDNKTTVFNRYCRAGFTSKVGLCSSVRQMHWYYEAGVANTLFPRCYNICQSDQMHAFVEDFRLTGCLSLLKWLVDRVNAEDEDVVRSPTGTVPLKALDFAIKRCSDYISAQSHEDIDQEGEKVWSHQWDQFISWYYQIVRDQALFVRTNVPFNKYILASKHVLKKMRKYWPQIDMDGVMNMWILKPGNKSRGRGIVLMNKLEDVVAKVNPTGKPDTRYVVQKYIERPLLIHNTKFDIRQWFIVTCAQPLTLWMYKESYLRFCSQKFSLDDFHESIHLCNHAIQCKYNNCGDRDSALPADNMWDATTFKEFLRSQGHADAWDEQIYPGMKQGLVGSLLASQEAMDRRKNSFELYGADFMVMEDFSVWLIEINSHPDMSYSTSVTTRLCRQVMENTLKVVVDFREDKNADTGDFELAYKQRMPSCQPYLGAALSLQGTRITTCEKKSSLYQDSKSSLVARSPMTKKKSMVHSNIGPVIVDLIEELEIQLDQELYSYYNTDSPKSRSALPATAPTKPLKAISDEKIETMTKSTSAGTTSINKTKSPTPSKTNVQNHTKSSNNGKRSSHKSTRKLRMSTSTANSKLDTSPRQTLISKIMALQEQSANETPKSEKLSRKNEDKIIKTAMRDAVKKYKRNVTVRPEVSPLPSLLTPPTAKVTPVSKSKSRSFPKKQTHHKKNKILTDISDMIYSFIEQKRNKNSPSSNRDKFITISISFVNLNLHTLQNFQSNNTKMFPQKKKIFANVSALDCKKDNTKKHIRNKCVKKKVKKFTQTTNKKDEKIFPPKGRAECPDFKHPYLEKCKEQERKLSTTFSKDQNQSKWQIILSSKNCTIKKHFEGWQICPKDVNEDEKNMQLILTVPNMKINSQCASETIKTADAEICCNREDLKELLGTDKESDRENGNIILTDYLKLITNDEARINLLLKILTKAVDEHKCYVICGTFPVLRKPLTNRGWIEKRAIRKMISIPPNAYEDGLQQIEKLLRVPADFIWHTNKRPTIRTDKTIVNKFAGSYFTSKVDMCNNLEKAYWFYETGVSNIQFPRCYNFYQSAQMEEFIQDYYITACFGILKWFTLLANLVGPKNTWSPNGTIPITVISFALERCVEYIRFIQIHEDIDRTDHEYTPLSTWDQFLDWYHDIIYKRIELVVSVNDIVKAMIKYRPQSTIDGIRNIWILKPGDDSLGRGIVLKSSLVDILAKVNQAAKENIEDILIRFASKDFTLNDFHESIHLCNTTVQLKYRKLRRCNSDLPEQRHWNLQDFKDYLQSRGQELAWEKIIRPGIKQNLIGALLASQDNMINRKNSFQLYGADFVVADDFSVWLLEINTNPRLHPPSSDVTAKLYPEVIEDAMKIILDRRKNKKAYQGKFECIYKQRNPFCGVNILGQGASLGIRGKGLFVTPKLPTT
ncbi:Tubulin glycylase 3A [Cyphomyrmex costatus]|uniref:Tubulin glycylase 3A n=2 Tax=Apocrita TaxID=7400 RepID=A0A195CUA4_9HYME|nr:Tubulin glycylase 3A [Cyphomyrmex costatus]